MKSVTCPNCDQRIIFLEKGEWSEKTCVCSNCQIPFVLFADRQLGLFFVDKISKPLIRSKPFLQPKKR
jgi:hypothetical protein